MVVYSLIKFFWGIYNTEKLQKRKKEAGNATVQTEIFSLNMSIGKLSGCIPINNDIIKIITYILISDVKKIFLFMASEKVLDYLNKISEIFLEQKLECRFKTLDYLKQINKL